MNFLWLTTKRIVVRAEAGQADPKAEPKAEPKTEPTEGGAGVGGEGGEGGVGEGGEGDADQRGKQMATARHGEILFAG